MKSACDTLLELLGDNDGDDDGDGDGEDDDSLTLLIKSAIKAPNPKWADPPCE